MIPQAVLEHVYRMNMGYIVIKQPAYQDLGRKTILDQPSAVFKLVWPTRRFIGPQCRRDFGRVIRTNEWAALGPVSLAFVYIAHIQR